MDDIRNLLRIASRRLEATSFLNRLHIVACVVAALAVLLIIIDRVGASAFIPWIWIAPILLLLSVIATFISWWPNRRSETSVAIEVDGRLDLRERLSTALAVANRDDPFARAAVEDAVRTARDARHREQIRRRFSVAPPRGWYASPLLLLCALIVSQISPLNLFSRATADRPEFVEARQEAIDSVDAIVKQIQGQPELNQEMADLLGDLTSDESELKELRSPEDARREAIKKVTELNRKLNEIVDGERGKTAEALQRKLRDLQSPSEGPVKELVEALNQGSFADAKKALEELMEQIRDGEMSEEQAEELAEQLQQLAEQLEALAEQQSNLERALQNAGLDPSLAQNPDALRQAIQNADHLNEQQKQQIQQMAQAQQAANQMCQGLSQACQAMAQGLAMGNMSGAEAGMGEASNQLSQMEQLQQLLQQAQAAANACEGQCQSLGQGLAMQQLMSEWSQGGAMGSWGQGRGGKAPIAPTPNRMTARKADVHTSDEGPIIARTLIDGQLERGESTREITNVVLDEVRSYGEALSEDQLPRKYDQALKHYFGELEQRVRAMQASDENGD